jgi:hypothetical protein
VLTARALTAVLAVLPAAAVCQSPLTPDTALALAREQRWDRIDGSDWNYLRRGSSKDDDIVQDDGAPFSPPDVLRIVFTPDMGRDQEPSVHWTALEDSTDIYAVWWIKLSANWSASPAGGGKIAFLHLAPDGQGQVYSNIGGSHSPHQITVNTEWAPYGQRVWTPNRTSTPIVYDRWYRIDWHVALPTGHARTATIRWWVDGVLNGDHSDVRVPGELRGFQQFEFAPTLQNAPPHEQYMYIDHTFINAPESRGHRANATRP